MLEMRFQTKMTKSPRARSADAIPATVALRPVRMSVKLSAKLGMGVI
jgi:hypothetical protein